ncbi:MAG: 50S ribosomal protein L30 [Chloroflexi bacterium]|nr:MAG: 50S ribosomal protein L30 [Chloroflexota bacterium]
MADKREEQQGRGQRSRRGQGDQREKRDGTLRVTWVHSSIGHNAAARGTIRALGLHRLHETVDVDDTPANRGMIRRVAFLLEVTGPARPAKSEDSGS